MAEAVRPKRVRLVFDTDVSDFCLAFFRRPTDDPLVDAVDVICFRAEGGDCCLCWGDFLLPMDVVLVFLF